MSLNNWIEISGTGKRARAIANSHKQRIQAAIKPYVLEAMAADVVVDYPARFKFDWYLEHRRGDLDNVAFMHKFIFDAFQGVSVEGNKFMSGDGLKFVAGLSDTFAGVDKQDPRVVITWEHLDAK
jgi:hypothetical protein